MHADNQLLWIFATANLVVALAITVWVLRRQRAQGGHLRLAISVLAGGLISPLVCPLWDHLTHTLHRRIGTCHTRSLSRDRGRSRGVPSSAGSCRCSHEACQCRLETVAIEGFPAFGVSEHGKQQGSDVTHRFEELADESFCHGTDFEIRVARRRRLLPPAVGRPLLRTSALWC